MLISLNWLRKYIPDLEITNLDKFRWGMDTRLSEVADIQMKGEGLAGLVTAELVSVKDLEGSNHLKICMVNDGSGKERQIVTGAPNAREGLMTVLCLPGGKVYDASSGNIMEIGERTMAGTLSSGMLCSSAELGLNKEHEGLIELASHTVVGEDVSNLFHDLVIEIENKSFPHRSDVFCHLGIAREVSAIFRLQMQTNALHNLNQLVPEEIVNINLNLEDANLSPRYTSIALGNIKVDKSPLWLQVMLSYAGVKPINNVVDITNYIMLDVGQPMHAFDRDKIEKNIEINVRKSKGSEKITTLDGQERELPQGTLVIADHNKPIAIAGIMGGEETKVTDETTNVLLEAANFEMYSIRRSSRLLGLRTDASTRYEKGLDPNLTQVGINQAVGMLIDIAQAEVRSNVVDIYPNVLEPKKIHFDLGMVRRFTGIEIDKTHLINIWNSLGLTIVDADKVNPEAFIRSDLNTYVDVNVPTFRTDISIPQDLLEEVARLYGYENTSPSLPKRDLHTPSVNKRIAAGNNFRNILAASGATEIFTYSMVGKELYNHVLMDPDELLAIMDSISPELSLVRNSLIPSILSKVKINGVKYEDFGLFEFSKVALKQTDRDTNLPLQPNKLAAVWSGREVIETYRKLKYSLDNLNKAALNSKLQIRQSDNKQAPYLHPAMAGEILWNNQVIGHIGVVHPLVLDNLGLSGLTLAAYELNIDELLNYEPTVESLKPLSTYPPVIRDLSLWQPQRTNMQNLVDAVIKAEITDLVAIEIVDLYSHKDKSSLTLRLTFQSNEHTLTQEEINSLLAQVTAIAEKLNYTLRS